MNIRTQCLTSGDTADKWLSFFRVLSGVFQNMNVWYVNQVFQSTLISTESAPSGAESLLLLIFFGSVQACTNSHVTVCISFFINSRKAHAATDMQVCQSIQVACKCLL